MTWDELVLPGDEPDRVRFGASGSNIIPGWVTDSGSDELLPARMWWEGVFGYYLPPPREREHRRRIGRVSYSRFCRRHDRMRSYKASQRRNPNNTPPGRDAHRKALRLAKRMRRAQRRNAVTPADAARSFEEGRKAVLTRRAMMSVAMARKPSPTVWNGFLKPLFEAWAPKGERQRQLEEVLRKAADQARGT